MTTHTTLTLTTTAILCLGGAVLTAGPVAAAPKHHHVAYFEKNTSFAQTSHSVEFTDDLFVGNHTTHAKRSSASDHFSCDFTSGTPICDGQIAVGGSMLLVHGKGGRGTFTIPITGGTGALRGAKGTLKVHDVGKHDDADLTVDYVL